MAIAKWHRYKPNEPELLSSKKSRVWKLVNIGIFSLLWNFGVFGFGVAGIFKGDANGFVICFMIPFMLIGLGLLAFCGYLFLQLFNPTTLINVAGRAAYAGGGLGIGWRINGKASRLTKLQIRFEGRESATYKRGTSTSTDTKVFMVVPVFESEKLEEFETGQARVDLSGVVMPTFGSSHNSVKYFLCVKGEIPNWPDIDDEFEIDIWPGDSKEELS